MKPKINLALVDDHLLFRKGLIQLFEKNDDFGITIESGDGLEFLQQIRDAELKPDVIILDMKLPGINGIACLNELKSIYPTHKTIILSMYDDNPIIQKALKSGARGYLLKNAEPEELFKAIESVHDSGYYISHELSKTLVENIQKPRVVDELSAFSPIHLSAVELEVLAYICQGLTNSEIADEVHRSKRTIEGYRQKLLLKTGAKNTAALVSWAFRKGIVE